jgi:hypothetical protein
MPRHQPGKGLVGVVFHIAPQQRTVFGWLHSQISVRRPAKADNLFATFPVKFGGARLLTSRTWRVKAWRRRLARITAGRDELLATPKVVKRNSAKLPVDF